MPDNQIALGHLVAPQIAMSPRGDDIIVISFAEGQPGQQTIVPLAKFKTRSWRIGAAYGLRNTGDGQEYWLQPLSENDVTPQPQATQGQPAPTQLPAAPTTRAPKPSAPRGAGGK
jgi:hypothetical protein